MFAKLQIELECDKLSYHQSSNLHGVLMKTMDTEYAGYLHTLQVNPFSQSLIVKDSKKIWNVNTLDRLAYEQIILPLFKLKEFKVKNDKMTVKIGSMNLIESSAEELLEELYQVEGEPFLHVSFDTPTAFKQRGSYINYPDLRLIYQGLMNRYNTIVEGIEGLDEEVLESLVSNSTITDYHLRTVKFPLEGIRITGFQGDIRIHVKGPDAMARYLRMLFRFGEYAGIGIKTGLGMGSIRLR